jgi:GT2 family glycosyltransferase
MIKFVCCFWNAEKYIKNCIRTLKSQTDKDFEVYEIQQCGSLYNDSGKLTCLQENGTIRSKLPACVKKEELINLLKMSIDNLRAENFSAVDSTLSNLVSTLVTCQ